jgi:uncharacterized protein
LIVVSDTSPVLNLSVIGQLELLRALYGTIVIPPTVAQELKRNQFDPETTEWIIVQVPKDHGAVQVLYQMLDPGESEAIILAQELRADLLLIDERRGWKMATGMSLPTTGLLGVLAEAKKKGLVEMCRLILDEMTQRAGFWVGKELRARYLASLGEMES